MVVHRHKPSDPAGGKVKRMRGEIARTLRDPFRRSILFSIVLIVAGFVAILLGWKGAARSILVVEQLPYLISGGAGGLALILTGAGLLSVQVTRYWNARERRLLDLVVARAAEVPAAYAESLISLVSEPPA